MMPSPFPGMDPYLESHWRDVHASLIIYTRDALQDSLPRELRARVERRVVFATPGGHVLAFPLENLFTSHHTPYMVCVRRATVRSKAEVYPIPLSQKLPTVKVPLRPTDADVPLDLQALVEQCYHKGRYEVDLDYR